MMSRVNCGHRMQLPRTQKTLDMKCNPHYYHFLWLDVKASALVVARGARSKF